MTSPQSEILYAEDHDDTCELVSLVLARLNFQVTTSSSVAEALRIARERNFCLYLLSSRLTDGSGVDLCKKLREFDQTTPIMFLSGAAYEIDKQIAFDSGAQRYLVKPMDLTTLCQEVSSLVEAGMRKEGSVNSSALSPQVGAGL